MGHTGDSGIRFIMPAPRNKRAKRAVEEFHNNERDAVSKYAFDDRGGSKNSCQSFNLVIIAKKEGESGWDSDDVQERYLTYATSIDGRNAILEAGGTPEEYKKRWGIETTYRDEERVRPRTTSSNASIRMFMFFVAVAMHGIWALSVAMSEGWHGRYDTAAIPPLAMLEIMEGLCVDVMDTGPGPPPPASPG